MEHCPSFFCMHQFAPFHGISRTIMKGKLHSNDKIPSFLRKKIFTKQYLFHRWWIEAFKSALSHRCTHYFVCFLSQCTMVIAGCNNWGKDNSYLGQYITYPLVIEMPRSLYDVCLNWNISLSRWLSTCKKQ